MENLSGSFSLCTCERNDPYLNTRRKFFQKRGGLILALCGLYNRIGTRFRSCRRAVAWVCVYPLVSGFFWVNSFNSVLIRCNLLIHILSLAIDIFFVRSVLQ